MESGQKLGRLAGDAETVVADYFVFRGHKPGTRLVDQHNIRIRIGYAYIN